MGSSQSMQSYFPKPVWKNLGKSNDHIQILSLHILLEPVLDSLQV